MKTFSRWSVLVVCLAVLTPAATSVAGDNINWSELSYEEILERAKTENKHIFIDFYTLWCGPCKRMDKDTYTVAGVEAFLNDMIPVKFDSENGEGIEISKIHKVNGWPTMVLLKPNGEEIDRHLGYLGPDDFLEKMKNYMKGIGTVADYRDKVEKNPNDAAAWHALAIKHGLSGRAEEAMEALDRFTTLKPDATDDEKAEVLYAIANVRYQSELYEDAARRFEAIIEEFPESEALDAAVTRLARTYHKLGREKDAIDMYMSYLNRYPEDPKAMNSFAWFCAQRGIGFKEALPVALEAVKRTDRDPGYLDTLAELYYAMGEFDKAIAVGQEALDKEPEDIYFKNQLDKFKEAKEEAERRAAK